MPFSYVNEPTAQLYGNDPPLNPSCFDLLHEEMRRYCRPVAMWKAERVA